MKEYIEKSEFDKVLKIIEEFDVTGPSFENVGGRLHSDVLAYLGDVKPATFPPDPAIQRAIDAVKYQLVMHHEDDREMVLNILHGIANEPSPLDMASAEIMEFLINNSHLEIYEDIMEILNKYRQPVGESNTPKQEKEPLYYCVQSFMLIPVCDQGNSEPKTKKQWKEEYNIPEFVWVNASNRGYFEEAKLIMIEIDHFNLKFSDVAVRPISDEEKREIEIFLNAAWKKDFSQLLEIEAIKEWHKVEQEKAWLGKKVGIFDTFEKWYSI